jgi:dolichyl-diphosphooligosaccharide--protein glycosyltransferase
MGLCPASLTRSVGGGFDNEAVAILPMMLTMYFWVRSLRGHDERSHRYGCLAGLMFFYLASCWAGYIFVLNLIALHAFGLVLMGRYTAKLYYSYSLFYIVGILLSMQLPIIGFTPVRNLDQISGLVVFMAFQGIHLCEYRVKTNELQGDEAKKYRLSFMFFTAAAALALATFFVPSSYFGPLNHRVKGIFFQHAKIGNPLVDSVAEHRSADKMAYYRYLHFLCIGAPLGFLTVVLYWGDASSFLVIYAISAFFLSRRMIRLIFLISPIASILSGTAIGRMVSHVLYKICELDADEEERVRKNELFNAASLRKSAAVISSCTNKKKKSVKKKNLQQDDYDPVGAMIKTAAYFSILFVFVFLSSSYQHYCIGVSRQLSDPTIIQLTKTKDGKVVKIDDYREAYWWLRDNTPDDARILAWWDYGYQISAIANRTTIADGNTWNYEHIALLGRVFTSCEEDGYNIARHLADYILVWAGGGADDLAKSSYMAKIANSVYGSICPDDGLDCLDFGFMDDYRSPSGVMSESLIYKLHSHNQKIGVATNPDFFKEVYESKHGKVKIFQILNVDGTSKAWVADPKNKVCDVPGGWLCRGQYPPALQTILSEKINSLNDINADNSSTNSLDSALNDAKKQKIDDREFTTKPNDIIEMEVDDLLIGKEVTAEAIEELSKTWKDTLYTSVMWKVITEGTVEDLQSWLDMAPLLAFVRSSDGRGPMFWAFEHRKHDMVHILLKCGVGHSDRDAKGLTPVDLLDSQKLD